MGRDWRRERTKADAVRTGGWRRGWKKENPTVMPCENDSYEQPGKQVEPNRRRSTSNKGLSVADEGKVPFSVIYGPRIWSSITNMAGLNLRKIFQRTAGFRALQTRSSACCEDYRLASGSAQEEKFFQRQNSFGKSVARAISTSSSARESVHRAVRRCVHRRRRTGSSRRLVRRGN